jgi:hypothetical protein
MPRRSVVLQVALVLALGTGPSLARPPNIIWLQSDSFDGRLLDPTNQAGYFHKLVVPTFCLNTVAAGKIPHITHSP